MPKLPSDYVKAPSFDNPLRSTTAKVKVVVAERELVLRFDAALWDALHAACAKESMSPEALIMRALQRWLAGEPEHVAEHVVAMTPRSHAAESPRRTSLTVQLLEQVQDQLTRLSWVRKLIALRAILRAERI